MNTAVRRLVRIFLRAAVLMLVLAGAPAAHALCTVTCSCNVSLTSVVFGTVNPMVASNTDSTGNVRVSCGGVAGLAIPYTVTMAAGASASIASRRMSNGAAQLSYNVYTTNSYTTVWGDGTGASGVLNGGFLLDVLGLAPAQNLTVYGRIPGSQTGVAPGSYTDTLVVTLTYY